VDAASSILPSQETGEVCSQRDVIDLIYALANL
jgi:hypothetical protein